MSMKNSVSISCIIPTYNGLSHLQKHLPSVLLSLENGDEMVICDDASTDETVNWLVSTFSLASSVTNSSAVVFEGCTKINNKLINIKLLVNKENLRFAQTVNQGVELVNNKYFFLVNNDVSLEESCLTVLKEQILSDDSIFAIGCLEYENNSKGEKSGKNELWFERGIFRHSKASNFELGETAWASGGSALFSTTKWNNLGGFDPVFYPAYWEDIDISFRARKRGWKILFNPEAIVYHQHESTNATVFGADSVNRMSWNNALSFSWKHANLWQRLQFIFWYPYWYVQRMKHRKT